MDSPDLLSTPLTVDEQQRLLRARVGVKLGRIPYGLDAEDVQMLMIRAYLTRRSRQAPRRISLIARRVA